MSYLQQIRLSENGKIIYELKNSYRDGTTHVVYEPLDFVVGLAALVTRPRMYLTRFHVIFAPNSRYRAEVAGQEKECVKDESIEDGVDIDKISLYLYNKHTSLHIGIIFVVKLMAAEFLLLRLHSQQRGHSS
jgi:hypothetical protein